MHRRTFCSAVAVGGIAIAGCSSDGNDAGGPEGVVNRTFAGGPKAPEPLLEVLSHSWIAREDRYGVRGVMINESNTFIEYAGVVVTFLDQDGQRIADAMDRMIDVDPGAVVRFGAVTRGDPDAVSKYVITPLEAVNPLPSSPRIGDEGSG